MKKTTKKISALLLAAVMTVSLAACGKTAPPAPNGSESAPTSDGGAGQSADKNTGSVDSFDLATTEFEYAGEFHDGYAWVAEKKGKLTLIDKKGNIKYQSNHSPDSNYISFESGVGYIGEEIIDLNGNVTYTLNNNRDDDGIAEEMIMQGGDKFLIKRTTSNMKENSTVFTVIDKNGVDLVKPIEVKFRNDNANWSHLGEGIFCCQYKAYESRIHCECILNPNAGVSQKFPAPENGHAYGFSKLAKTESGKAWQNYEGNDGGKSIWGVAIFDLATMDSQLIQTEGAYYVSGKTAYINDAAYDLSGNKIADFPINGNKDTPIVYIGEYSDDGYVPVILQGKDSSYYITYLDKSGNERFSPIKTGKYDSDKSICTPTHFICYGQGSTVTLYDNSGTAKTEIKSEKSVALYDDYMIAEGKYYFF